MTDEELIARLHLPWPKDESVDEVTVPLWVLELTAEAADRIEQLVATNEAQAAEIERLRGAMAKLIGGSETVLEAWDHHMRDAVVPRTLHDAIEELRADVAEAKVDKP